MKKTWFRSIGIILVGLLLIFSVPSVSAKSNSSAKLYSVKGRTITVSVKKGKGTECGIENGF